MTTHAVRIHCHGGPDVLEYEKMDLPAPAAGQALVRQTAIGLNYAGIYRREGEHGPHDANPLPIMLGSQAAEGIIPTAPERRHALADIRQAHRDLQSRSTTGPAVLLP